MSLATHTINGVPIPRGLVWVDEHDWTPVQKSAEYSTTGALLVDSGVRQAGRPITLQAQDDAGWSGATRMTRAKLDTLRQMAAAPTAVYPLLLADGRAFDVMFAPENPIEAHPVGRPELPPPAHPYVVTLRFLEV